MLSSTLRQCTEARPTCVFDLYISDGAYRPASGNRILVSASKDSADRFELFENADPGSGDRQKLFVNGGRSRRSSTPGQERPMVTAFLPNSCIVKPGEIRLHRMQRGVIQINHVAGWIVGDMNVSAQRLIEAEMRQRKFGCIERCREIEIAV